MKLFRKSQRPPSNEPAAPTGQRPPRPTPIVFMGTFPAKLPLLKNKLTVWVFQHTLGTLHGDLPCWSYATDGLRACGQKEIIFTLRRNETEKPEGFPADPLFMFQKIYEYAERGQFVDQGSYTEMAPPGLFGRGDLVGLAYTAPQFPPGLDYTRSALSAILLTAEELAVGKQFGFTRVLALLGQAYRYYPCPPWADLERPSLVSLANMQAHSFLAKPIPQVFIPGTTFRLEDRARLVLRVMETRRQNLSGLVGQLPPHGPVMLLTGPDPQANACLVWQPGQTGTQAIIGPSGPNERMTGNFITLCGERETDQLQIVEDGLVVWLTDDSYAALWEAFTTGQPFTRMLAQPGASPVAFALEWVCEVYRSPVNGTEYVAAGGWTSAGSGNQPIPGKRVQPAQVILLNSDDELRARLTADDFNRYLKTVIQAVEEEFGLADEQPGQDLILQIEIAPGAVTMQIASRPGIDPTRLAALEARLKTIPAPPVKEGPVRFQAFFWLWGGSGEPLPGVRTGN